MSNFIRCLFIITLVVGGQSAFAVTPVPMTLENVIVDSEIVLVGRVTSKTYSRSASVEKHGYMDVYENISLTDVTVIGQRGRSTYESEYRISQWYGLIHAESGKFGTIAGLPVLNVNREYILMLTSDKSEYSPYVGYQQGVFEIVDNKVVNPNGGGNLLAFEQKEYVFNLFSASGAKEQGDDERVKLISFDGISHSTGEAQNAESIQATSVTAEEFVNRVVSIIQSSR